MNFEWGSSKVLRDLDIKKLSVAKLKSHLEARDEPVAGESSRCEDSTSLNLHALLLTFAFVAGNKRQLVERLENR